MKRILLIFSNGASVTIDYSPKIFKDLSEKIGKDEIIIAKTFSANMKYIVGVFYVVQDQEGSKDEE